ncbi:hypothetical protein [Moraxella bovis]|uniref:hypothetical protein n=1 Tax=Moraxella bovis TaxID=476 RepID=UPI00227A51C8|nr:hypothetical protein [Moraxella bovis]WAJ73931.1 hypothetical protein LP095_01750 [Moraxella bovis]
MIRLLFVLMVFIIGVVGLQACHADNSPLTPPQTVTLHFGHQGVRDFYAYTHGVSEDYPKILNFSDLTWYPPKLGTVNIRHSNTTVKIPYTFLVVGVRDSRYLHGIGGMDISAGLSQTEFTTQEQAYQDYVALITAFKKAGWQQYFKPFNTRIAKEDNFKLIMYENPSDTPKDRFVIDSGYSSDSLTLLNFKEWQTMMSRKFSRGWNGNLYLRDVTVWININKTATKPNPIANQPDLEQYMVDFHFETAKYEFYGKITDEETTEQLRQVYDESQSSDKEFRQDYETHAKNAGFSINESYQDPDMWQYIIEPAY